MVVIWGQTAGQHDAESVTGHSDGISRCYTIKWRQSVPLKPLQTTKMHSPVVMMRSSILPSMQFETALNRKAFPEREWKLCSPGAADERQRESPMHQTPLLNAAWWPGQQTANLTFDSRSPCNARCAVQMEQQ